MTNEIIINIDETPINYDLVIEVETVPRVDEYIKYKNIIYKVLRIYHIISDYPHDNIQITLVVGKA